MGDDEKLISDIVDAAEALRPRFIAVAGTPIPTMTGFDFTAVAELIEQRTGIPAFGFSTTGMNSYVHGADMALAAVARRFVDTSAVKTAYPSANILGLTPLDFTVNGTDRAISQFLEDAGFSVISRWAMGSSLDELSQAGGAHVNLVVSASGLGAAKTLQEQFGTPYVVGIPFGEKFSHTLQNALRTAAATGQNQIPSCHRPEGDIIIIGEGIFSKSLACAIELHTEQGAAVICPTECDSTLLRSKDLLLKSEEEIEGVLANARVIIADPLFRPICPSGVRFVALPAEAFSGRIYRQEIPNLVSNFQFFLNEVL